MTVQTAMIAGQILIVGESDSDLHALNAMLAARGYNVRQASDLAAAREAARQSCPDLILLVDAAAGLDGRDFGRQPWADGVADTIPVLLVGAPGGPLDPVELLAAGVTDYLVRPIREPDVLARIKLHLEVKDLRRELAAQAALLGHMVAHHTETEERLRQSEEKFRGLVENVSDVLYSLDRRGIVTYLSPAIEPLLGYSAADLVGCPAAEFMHPDDRPLLARALDDVLAGQSVANEYRLVARSGEIRWIRTSSRPLTAAGRVIGTQGVLADITDRKLAEEKLQRQNEFLRSVLESLTHPFYVINATDYTVEIANSAARRSGMAEQVPCYSRSHGATLPCDSLGHSCPLEEVKRSRQPVTVEHIHRSPDGTQQYVEVRGYPLFDDDGQVARVIEYVLDVTDRRQAEERRQLSERQYRQLLDTLQEGIWVIDAEARTSFVNPRMAEMLGYGIEEMQGRHLFEFMDDEGKKIAQVKLEHRAQGIREQHDFEFVRRDGSRLYALLETSPIMSEEGQFQGALAGVQDISARRQIEQAMREARDAADEARRKEEERREEVRRRREIAQAMQGVLAALNSNRSLDLVLNFIAAQAVQVLGVEAVAVYRWSGADETWVLQAAQGLAADWGDVEESSTACEALKQASARRQVVIGSGPPADPASAAGPRREPAAGGPPESLLSVPIILGDKVYGGAVLQYAEPRTLSAEDVELAEIFGYQFALAVENARLKDEAQQAAIDAERNRLARDLHDSVTQALFSASLVAEVLPQVWRREPNEAELALDELRHLTHGALAEMRALLLELRPTTLLNARLDDLIAQLTAAVAGRSRLAVSLDLAPIPELPPDVQITFYRTCQEAMQNVVKHARAGQLAVHVRASPPAAPQQDCWRGQVLLQVSDDGQGFDPHKVRPDGMGLRIMRERAESIDACLNIDSQPGEGTRVTLVWNGGQRPALHLEQPGSGLRPLEGELP